MTSAIIHQPTPPGNTLQNLMFSKFCRRHKAKKQIQRVNVSHFTPPSEIAFGIRIWSSQGGVNGDVTMDVKKDSTAGIEGRQMVDKWSSRGSKRTASKKKCRTQLIFAILIFGITLQEYEIRIWYSVRKQNILEKFKISECQKKWPVWNLPRSNQCKFQTKHLFRQQLNCEIQLMRHFGADCNLRGSYLCFHIIQ